MGRHDGREERLMERLVSDLETALARRQTREACATLVKLTPEARAPRVPPVAALFRDAVVDLHARGSYGDMGFFAARAGEEPGLVVTGATASEADETRWALFVGMCHTKDWVRASGLLALLEPALATEPEVLAALSAYVVTKGEPDPLLLDRLVPATQADPRLGYGAMKAVVTAPNQPRTPEEAEAATLRLRLSGGFERFATTLQTWLSQLAPQTALAVQAAAVPLAAREALELLRLGREARTATQLLARVATNLPWTAELEADVLAVFRAAAARLPKVPETDRQLAVEYAALVPVLWSSERFWPGVRAHLLALRIATQTTKPVVEAIRRLLEKRPDPLLWAKGARLYFIAEGPRAPEPWLVAGLRATLAVDGWAVAIATTEEQSFGLTLQVLANGGYPDELTCCALDALLAASPSERRGVVVANIAAMIQHELDEDDDDPFGGGGFDSFLNGMSLMQPSTPRAKSLARHFGQLAAESSRMLEQVLASRLPDREAIPLVEAFLGPRPTALRLQQGLSAALKANAGAALDHVEDRMLASDVATLVDLWEAFIADFDAPPDFIERLAGRILVATASLPNPDERTRDAMVEARYLAGGRSRAKKPAKKKPAKKKPAKKKPAKKSAAAPTSPKPRAGRKIADAPPSPEGALPAPAAPKTRARRPAPPTATEPSPPAKRAPPGGDEPVDSVPRKPARQRPPRQTRLPGFGSDE